MFGWFKERRRRSIRSQAFPEAWRRIIATNVPYVATLTADERAELQGHVLVLLSEKNFEGAGGLQLTDEIRVTIAAQASLLLLNRQTDYYPGLESIVVYPTRFVVHEEEVGPHGVVTEGPSVRLGESWTRGTVILAWDDVQHGASDMRDGHNVVLHEFAHQLDQEDGNPDGAPVLPKRGMYAAWARVLSQEYEEHLAATEAGRRLVIDEYGAENHAEFFAVVTETFFEKPRQLRDKHPELYEQLRLFYRQDPAERF